MKIRKFSKLDNGVYSVTIFTEDWSELDKLLMERYGQPEINVGGNFVAAEPYLAYDLPDDYRLIMSDSPFTQGFDSRDYIDADTRAELWKDTIVERLVAAIVTLRENDDTFTQEEIDTV